MCGVVGAGVAAVDIVLAHYYAQGGAIAVPVRDHWYTHDCALLGWLLLLPLLLLL